MQNQTKNGRNASFGGFSRKKDPSFLYKKTSDTKWTTKQGFKENAKVDIKPSYAANYDICVKVKDNSGKVGKQYLTVTVK